MVTSRFELVGGYGNSLIYEHGTALAQWREMTYLSIGNAASVWGRPFVNECHLTSMPELPKQGSPNQCTRFVATSSALALIIGCDPDDASAVRRVGARKLIESATRWFPQESRRPGRER
jgi:hypothetical protein